VRHALVAFAVLLAATALACGGPDEPTTGIYGIAVANQGGREPPSSPLPGGFGMSEYIPFRRAVVVVRKASEGHDGEVIARAQAKRNGLFRIALPPGRYIVSCTVGDSVAEPVTVHDGSFARVIVLTPLRF
jgi:hypothetical protein